MSGAAVDEEFSEVGGELDPTRAHSNATGSLALLYRFRMKTEIEAGS